MEIIKVNKKDLIFNNVDNVSFKSKLPLLINQYNEVIFGNCIKDSYDSEVKCIRIESYALLVETLKAFEEAIVKENSFERFNNIENELQRYLSEYFDKNEKLTFFETNELKEKRCISNTHFRKPPAYNFHKGKKNKEQEENYNLFTFEE